MKSVLKIRSAADMRQFFERAKYFDIFFIEKNKFAN
jgi:hypothetical protein